MMLSILNKIFLDCKKTNKIGNLRIHHNFPLVDAVIFPDLNLQIKESTSVRLSLYLTLNPIMGSKTTFSGSVLTCCEGYKRNG